MGSRWVNLAVIVLWLAAMSWLVKSKVLPTFETGNPPIVKKASMPRHPSRRWDGSWG